MSRRNFLRAMVAVTSGLALGQSAQARGRDRRHASRLVTVVPPAYMRAAAKTAVPARLMYAIALQESAMAFGPDIAPWPWTLNVRGTPYRYETYADAVAALEHCIRVQSIRNVDCGPMQINWGYHADKLRSPAKALDAYNNLEIGARILRGHFDSTHNWFTATRWYHNQLDQARSLNYANGVFRRLPALVDGAFA